MATYIVHADLIPSGIQELFRNKFIKIVQQKQALNILGIRKFVQRVRQRQKELYLALD
jgi:hypothetical protein